jgi:hypothetical protein
MRKVIIIFVALLFIGCGARKVQINKSKVKELIRIDSIAKTTEESTIEILVKKDVEVIEFNFEPIDNTLDFVVDGKIYRNVRISHKKEKDNTIVNESKTTSKIQDISLNKAIQRKEDKLDKNIKKEGINIPKIISILLLSILVIAYIYFYFRKKHTI